MTETLDRLRIPYFVTDSTATIAYGEPRFTNSIDMAVRLSSEQSRMLLAEFTTEDFYLAPESVERALRDHSSFNLIHPRSGLKIDFMVVDDSPFNLSRFERATLLGQPDGRQVRFASPEDVILKKLEYFRQGGSEKHLRDIAGVLRVSGDQLDVEYISRWAETLDVREEWKLARDTASRR